jgi:hypothetical protein
MKFFSSSYHISTRPYKTLRSSTIANKTEANYKIFSNQTLIARGEREANGDQHVH